MPSVWKGRMTSAYSFQYTGRPREYRAKRPPRAKMVMANLAR